MFENWLLWKLLEGLPKYYSGEKMLLCLKKLLQEPLSETQRMGGARVGEQEPSEEVTSRSKPHAPWGATHIAPPVQGGPQQGLP